ncbi:interleukin-8-like [Spea bombifrons]|uniref:interleukin-8-like n=1 Tax=Spea bombifrons TaxID=233779 RepID=UPI002349DD96|nr:interleukin-8-like [Spea bombifrons]
MSMQYKIMYSSLLSVLMLLALYVAISNEAELRCECVKTTSNLFPKKHIANVEIINSGPHCPKMEIIVTLKNQKQFCLDSEAKWVKEFILAILKRPRKSRKATEHL